VDSTDDVLAVRRLRAGDREAFAQVYERYKGDVLALVSTMLGRQEEAWDVLHDVFVSLARNAPRLWPTSDLKRYLLTAAANKARDRLKRRTHAATDLDAAPEPPGPPAEEPSRVVSTEEEAHRLRQAVASLPEEQRIVIALHVYGGLSFREIAAGEEVSENTVQSRYRYALEKLRRLCSGEAE